jgi:hypothetical protein
MQGLKAAIFVAFLACSTTIGAQYFVDEENPENLLKRQASKKCFEPVDDVEQQAENIADILREESVEKCFTRLNIGSGIITLYQSNDTDIIGEFFDAEASKFCPTWPTSKKCIYDYLKNNCNEKEVLKVQESAAFYYRTIAYPVLMCEPKWEFLSRFFLQSWKSIGLYDCFAEPESLVKFLECSGNKKKTHVESGYLPNFKKTLNEYAACAYPVISDCSNGDNSTELEMTTVLNLITHAFENSFDLFWSDFFKQ